MTQGRHVHLQREVSERLELTAQMFHGHAEGLGVAGYGRGDDATYRFSVDNGVVFHNTYGPDGTTLHYETVAGPGTGASEDVTLHAAEVAPGVFLLGWVEKSGMTVTHAMNLHTSTVHAFWTYETAEGRIGELHVGTLEQI